MDGRKTMHNVSPMHVKMITHNDNVIVIIMHNSNDILPTVSDTMWTGVHDGNGIVTH